MNLEDFLPYNTISEDVLDYFDDDSKDQIVGRVVARLRARGLDCSHIGTDGWRHLVPIENEDGSTTRRTGRDFILQVTKDGETLGRLVVRETRAQTNAVKYRGFMTKTTSEHTTAVLSTDGAVKEDLGI